MTQRRRDAVIGIAAGLGVIAFVIAAAVIHEVGFPLDDAWIHQTYARNLAERGEWAFVPGEPSAASTSPLYTVVLAAGRVLHVPFFVWTFGTGALALAAGGWIAVRLGERLFPELVRAHVGLWTGLAVVVTWHLVWAAASGMETMLFAALSLLIIWLAWRERDAVNGGSGRVSAAFQRGTVLGLAGAALTITRPEGVGLIALTGLTMLLAWPYRDPVEGRRLYVAWGTGVVVGWGIGVAPYLALNAHIEGTMLPNTSAAKQAEYAVARDLPIWERYGRLLLTIFAGGQFLLIPGMMVGLAVTIRRATQDRRAWLYLLPGIWSLVHLSAYVLLLPVTYQHGRYVIPVLPHLLVYGVGGTLVIMKAARRSPVQRVAARTLALSAVLVMPGFFVIGAQQYGRDVRIINTEMVAAARWVSENIPPDQLLAVHDIGALGYYAPRPILDLAGLVSPEIVPFIRDHETLMQWMCEQKAVYLMVFDDQRPARPDDPRLGTETIYDPVLEMTVTKPVFKTDAPYAPAAGGNNMVIYQMNWPSTCN